MRVYYIVAVDHAGKTRIMAEEYTKSDAKARKAKYERNLVRKYGPNTGMTFRIETD